jgi:hypothetical protein
VTILADRGFGRAEWAAVCQELKFRYVVRIKPEVTISCSRYRGVLRRYPTRKGMAHLLKGVDYRKDKRVRHKIVIRWRPDLPKKRDEPWFLMTDLEGKAERVCQLYGRRMSVDIEYPDYHPSEWVSASLGAGCDRHPGAAGARPVVPSAARAA